MIQNFRVARHTGDIDRIKDFYIRLVGLNLLYEFNHDGYLGVMLGQKKDDWHLEFTMSDKNPSHCFDDEDALVFYIEDDKMYIKALERFKIEGIDPVKSANPYWDIYGRTYVDPDGYRIVICHKEWKN
ncbi:MAG: VOC family protein [Acidaminobacteraceae bacterium]